MTEGEKKKRQQDESGALGVTRGQHAGMVNTSEGCPEGMYEEDEFSSLFYTVGNTCVCVFVYAYDHPCIRSCE